MNNSSRRPRRQPEKLELGASRAAVALNSGVLSSLRSNASAYGYSVSITAAFAMVSAAHPLTTTPVNILFFAIGAATAFFLVEMLSSRMFRQVTASDEDRVVFISGSVDVLAIIASSATAVPLAEVAGRVAWPLTAFGATLVFLLAGGVDILIARALVRRENPD